MADYARQSDSSSDNLETAQDTQSVSWQVTVAQALATPLPAGELAAQVLSHGSMLVEFYAPERVDPQTPHTRDELYVVIQGSGWFVQGEQRVRFGHGDVLFVPAGAVHRFEDFSDDFQVWVIFYGPEGGENSR